VCCVVLMVATFVGVSFMSFVHRVHMPNLLPEADIPEPQKLHHHVSSKLGVDAIDVEIHVSHAIRFVHAFVSHESAQWVAMGCRIIRTANQVLVKGASAFVAELDQRVHHEVGRLHVSQSVCEQIQIYEDTETLEEVL
jgi:hypothetical protein